jgi:hypothetical protein
MGRCDPAEPPLQLPEGAPPGEASADDSCTPWGALMGQVWKESPLLQAGPWGAQRSQTDHSETTFLPGN